MSEKKKQDEREYLNKGFGYFLKSSVIGKNKFGIIFSYDLKI